jgi:hypothetical protein
MKMAAMKLGNTPRPAAWRPPLAYLLPPVLIFVTSSSNSLPHLAAAAFWWMASVEWLDVNHNISLGRLGCCIYANLVFINLASSRVSWFSTLHCRCYISHIRTPNNTNSVSKLCATKLSPTLVFIAFLGNEDKIHNQSQKIICLISDLSAPLAFSGGISPCSLTRIGPSTCPNRRYRLGPQLCQSNFCH